MYSGFRLYIVIVTNDSVIQYEVSDDKKLISLCMDVDCQL